MQLRVARLCLDCEELHADDSCPRCASERYAFLSAWLPSEERRRWRRPPVVAASKDESWSHGAAGFVRSVGRWLSGDRTDAVRRGPATRASDYAAQLKFGDLKDDVKGEPAVRRRLDVHLSKHDGS